MYFPTAASALPTFDRDGTIELVFGTSDGCLHCWELGSCSTGYAHGASSSTMMEEPVFSNDAYWRALPLLVPSYAESRVECSDCDNRRA